MPRSIFLKNESFNDVQTALNQGKSDMERKHIISDRLKANGWTKDKELQFRRDCEIVGFILPFQRQKENGMAKNPNGVANARILADAIKHDFRQSKTVNEVE